MSQIPTLIQDLALILISAGVITIIFKWLKQPLVLGYIVAGILSGPHITFMPTVVDTTNVQTWADIGIIFLLFALGLDFSFKKLMRVGGPAVIAAMTIIAGMLMLGMLTGTLFGWSRMNCLFLGGMVAMSSTSIIYKALEDLGLRSQRFSGLVLGILVIEDLVAVVLMVLLSTIAVRNTFEGSEMIWSIGKLIFFLLIWFTVGIFLIPSIFGRARRWMNDETLLIVAVGLCLLMVVLASHFGYSSALGAFVMGSILAETIEAEKIERLVKPIKDLFAAIFFVSVGMMVDPVMIWEYKGIIAVLIVVILIGQPLLGTFGVVLAGQPLKVGLQCGFSLAQIGEFAFIIAGLGVSLGVTSDFLYPVVVAVSVITTFLTPYMMRFAEPLYPKIDKVLPRSWHRFLDRYSGGVKVENHRSNWKNLLTSLLRIMLFNSVIIIAILALSFTFLVPFVAGYVEGFWGSLISAVVIIVCIAPFLRAIVAKKNHSIEFTHLWADNRFNRGYLVSLIVFRFVLAVMFVMFVVSTLFKMSIGILLGIAVFTVAGMMYSRYLKKQSIMLERRFKKNLNIRDIDNSNKKKRPEFAGHLLSHDLHMTDLVVSPESLWVGCTLAELSLKTKYGVNIVAIFRGEHCLNIPGGTERLYPGDRIQVIGSDQQLLAFGKHLESHKHEVNKSDLTQSSVVLKQFMIDAKSLFKGKSIVNSGIRDKYKCLIVGIERGDSSIRNPKADFEFEENDIVWIVGEKEDVEAIIKAKIKKLETM